ncbi:MAG: hypothetical protein JXA93_01720 [Anaerolineae bacterium]|nr:hypothetical protein [Anaerolineae bacterium]
MRCDLVIIGAGVAGLSVAAEVGHRARIEGRERDAPRVVVVDDRQLAGERTILTFVQEMTAFGLEESILRVYRAFGMRSSLASHAVHDMPEPGVAAVDYRRLCLLLGERVASYPTVQRISTRVTGLQRAAGGWEIRLANRQALFAPIVVDASGASQLSARRRSRLYSHSYGELLDGCEVDDAGVGYFLGGGPFATGGGWFYPLGEGRASFGFAQVTHRPHISTAELEAGFRRARSAFEPLARAVAAARTVGVEMGTIPVEPVMPLVEKGLMRVGDAAGQATPWMCMGVERALVNGSLCGRLILDALHRDRLQVDGLRHYEKAWRQLEWRRYRQAMLLAPLQWVKDEERWDRAIAAQNRFTPEEMMAKLRENYPFWSLPTLYWFRAYHLLGLVRRGIRDRIVHRGAAPLSTRVRGRRTEG